MLLFLFSVVCKISFWSCHTLSYIFAQKVHYNFSFYYYCFSLKHNSTGFSSTKQFHSVLTDWMWWLQKTMWPSCGPDKPVQHEFTHVRFSTDQRLNDGDVGFISFIRGNFCPIHSVVGQLCFSRWATAVFGLN